MRNIELKEFTESTKEYNLRGITIIQKGEEVLRYNPVKEKRENIYSCTKTFTSVAVGMAIDEGLFSLEDYVVEHFKEDIPDNPGPLLKKMKLKHLITMSMGFEEPMLMGAMRQNMTEKDWVKFVLKAKVVDEPGAKFMYNNAGPYLLGVLIQRKTGISLIEYLKPRLFEPLGIEEPECEVCPKGYTFGAGGYKITVTELSRLGQLYLQKGKFNNKQVVSKAWIEESTKMNIETNGDREIGMGYGYLLWIMPDGMFRIDGKYEQYSIVYPKKDAVISVSAMNTNTGEDEKAILRKIVRYIVPQL